jgi:hypothetical protein
MVPFRGAEAPRLRKKSGPGSIDEGNVFSDGLLGGCPKTPQTVTPAQAGVHRYPEILDPRFRGDDEWTLNGANLPLSDRLLGTDRWTHLTPRIVPFPLREDSRSKTTCVWLRPSIVQPGGMSRLPGGDKPRPYSRGPRALVGAGFMPARRDRRRTWGQKNRRDTRRAQK